MPSFGPVIYFLLSIKLVVAGGIFGQADETPFNFGKGEGINTGADSYEWVVQKDRIQYDTKFEELNPVDGKVS